MSEKVSIKGLDKAAVLAALYNNSQPVGMGWLQAVPGGMTVEDARKEMDAGDDRRRMFPDTPPNFIDATPRLYFDYLRGRPLKVDLSGDEFSPWGYDRDNGGPGTAARIVEALRTVNSL